MKIHFYMLVNDNLVGHSVEKQKAMLRRVYKVNDDDLYRMTEIDELVRILGRNTGVAIALHCVVGTNLKAVGKAIDAITGAGAVIHVLSEDRIYGDGTKGQWKFDFALKARDGAKELGAAHARKALAKLGSSVQRGRKPALVEGTKKWDRALAIWLDRTKSQGKAAEEAGFAVSTLHKTFGPRGTPPFGGKNDVPAKKLKPKARKRGKK